MKKLVETKWKIEKDAPFEYLVSSQNNIGSGNWIELYFGTLKSAIAFCRRNGFKYKVINRREGV